MQNTVAKPRTSSDDHYRQKMIDTAYEAGFLKGHISALEGKIKALETENARLRAQLEDAE